MEKIVVIGGNVGIASHVANMANLHSLADTVIIVDELQKQNLKEPKIFPIKSVEHDYYEVDHLTRKKKPANKEWQKRIKNLQNSRK